MKYQAYRAELYFYQGFGGIEVRFPRYSHPFKLPQTKIGRCGEWANFFGAILYACEI